jgi:hypothetical protein
MPLPNGLFVASYEVFQDFVAWDGATSYRLEGAAKLYRLGFVEPSFLI